MKKLKLLAGLSAIGVVSGGVALSATSCTWTYKGGNSSLDPKLEINVEDASISAGTSDNLTVTIKYDGGADKISEMKAESSDTSILIIEGVDKETGQIKIKGLKAGTAKITVTVIDIEGRVNKKTVEVTVEESSDEYTIEVGEDTGNNTIYKDNPAPTGYGFGGANLKINGIKPTTEQDLKIELTTHNTNLTDDLFSTTWYGSKASGKYILNVNIPDSKTLSKLNIGTDYVKVIWNTPSGKQVTAENQLRINVSEG